MRVKTLAKMFARFRKKFRTIEDECREKNLVKYYTSLIKLNQVFPLFNEGGILIALCEVWKIKKEDIQTIKEKKIPQSISEGDIIFVANVTFDPNFRNTGVFKFYRKFLQNHIFKEGYKGAFWYIPKRKRFSRIVGG